MNRFRKYSLSLIIILLVFSSMTITSLPVKYSAAQVSGGNVISTNNTSTPNLGNGTTSITPIFAKINVSALSNVKSDAQLSDIPIPLKGYNPPLQVFSKNSPFTASNTVVTGNPPIIPSDQIQRAQTTITGFDGLNEQQTNRFPPDVQMAVGPNHVVEMVNSNIIFFSKSGTIVSGPNSLISFFSAPSGDHIFDPKILYDSNSGRWFASSDDGTTDIIYLSVSSTNDPTGSWTVYHFTVFQGGSTYSPDQPILGVSDDKVALSVNDFDSLSHFVQSQFDILNKSDLLVGASTVHGTLFTETDFSIHPVQSMSSTSTLYMVNTDSANSIVKLWSVTGVPTALNSIIATPSTVNLSIGSIVSPPKAVQPGTSAQIDTGGTRIFDAVWYLGNLWLTFGDSCTPTGDSQARSCLHLTEINTNSQSVTQNFDYGSVGYYYFYPAIRIDGSGNLDLVYGYSSASVYPSIAISGQATTDTLNTLQSSAAAKVGGGAVTQTDTSGRVRYGDYFAAAVDPSNTSTVWVAGEYIGSNVGTVGWSTFISSMTINNNCSVPTTGDWTVTSSCTLASTATASANVIVNSGTVLTIPSGVILTIHFVSSHLLVTSGGGVLIKAGGAIN